MTNKVLETLLLDEEVEVITKEDLVSLADEIKKLGDYEVSIKKLIGSYGMSIFGSKKNWTNGIAQNSNIKFGWIFDKGVADTSSFAYQMKNAGIKKNRKIKYKSFNDLKKKILDYIKKNKAVLDELNK